MPEPRMPRFVVIPACRLALLLLPLFAFSACSHGDPYFFLNPKLPVSVPFAMDKAGNKAGIDFWVVPGNVDLDKTYMVSFSFDRKHGLDPMQLFMGDHPSLRPKVSLRLWLINNQNQTRVPLKGRSLNLAEDDPARTPGAFGDDLAYLRLRTWDGNVADMLVASFKLEEYGHYRAEIEVLQDTPALQGIPSELIVKEVFNRGK